MWEEWHGVLDGAYHFVFRLADGDAADGVSVEADFDEFFGGLLAEVCVGAALDDAKKQLASGGVWWCAPREVAAGVLAVPFFAALCPAGGEGEGVCGVFFLTGVGGALVKEHGDVAAEGGLDFHAELRGEHGFGAVDVVGELDALLGDFAEFGK